MEKGKNIKAKGFDPREAYEEVKRNFDKQYQNNLISIFEKLKIVQIPAGQSLSVADASIVLLYQALHYEDFDFARKVFKTFYQEMKVQADLILTLFALWIEGMGDLVFLKQTETGRILPLTKIDFFTDIFQISQKNYPVLIVGETGTSKQFLAKAIHELSERRKKKFIQINCTAITETLLEGELFGWLKGSFTGAVIDKKGLLEEANGGTFFLDEIGKMASHLQSKLLKVIDEQEIRRIGSTESIKIDVRFITATQPDDLEKIICDLQNRLGSPDFIEMPTLEERFKMGPSGHVVVIDNALKEAKRQTDVEDISIDEKSYSKLRNHKYRGNYRELINILRAAIRKANAHKRQEITPEDLEEVMEKGKRFYERGKPSVIGEDLENVLLKDILTYANEKRASIIEAKMLQVLRAGKTVKTELLDQGLSENDYTNFREKVVKVVGKKIRDLQL